MTPTILGYPLTHIMSLSPKVRISVLSFLVRWERYEEALPLAEQLAADQPDGFLYRSRHAKLLCALGRSDEAAPIVSDLTNLHPTSLHALSAASELAIVRGDLPEALKCCFKMVEVRPESVMAWRGLARVYFAANQVTKAHANCRKAIEIAKSRGSDGDGRPAVEDLRMFAQIHRARGDELLAGQIDEQVQQAMRDDEERIAALLREAQPATGQKRSRTIAPGTDEPVPEPEPNVPPAPPLSEDALDCLQRVFGYDNFRAGQGEVVSRAIAGEDQLVIMPTGAGKSLCYQLPAALGKRVVVISPLIALMKDQVDGLPVELAPKATLVNSTIESDELERRLRDIVAGRYNIVYAAPERLRQAPFLHALKRAKLDLFVVDEVHCVSIWGHDFRPDYLFIASALEMIGNPPFLGMTATAGPEMRREIKERIGRELVTTSVGTYRPNLILEVKNTSREADKLRETERICHHEQGSGIVYVNSRRKAEDVAEHLSAAGVEAGFYHAGMESGERAGVQESFMTGKTRVMAATVAFGMGVDKPDVRFVVHFTMPKSVENYYQEAGRAGRDGRPAKCILLYSSSDKAMQTNWARAQALGVEDVSKVYHALRRLVPTGGPVHEDDIIRESGFDERVARVAVSLLERVGLIRRRLDVPMTVTLRVEPGVGWTPEFGEFVERARLRRGQRIALGLEEVSARTGLSPAEIEEKLLEWTDEGVLSYRASGRTMFIEFLEGGAGAKSALEEMLAAQLSTAERKIERLGAYVKTKHCRHRFISKHFGESLDEDCRTCDNCAASAAPSKLGEEHVLILKGVDCLPVRMASPGLVRALVGAPKCPIQAHEWPHLGALAHRAMEQVERMVGDLIDWGYLVRDGSIIRPVLELSMAGRRLLHGEMQNEKCKSQNDRSGRL